MNIDEIFAEAVEIESQADRIKYLDGVCAGNPQLRAQVEALLAAHDEAGSFLESPARQLTVDDSTPTATLAPPTPITEGPGATVGRYKLLQKIGEGGMGVVYMAQQENPVRRRVALKIIKPGMDSQQVIARFEAERQALAMMDHPNIARVLDAGCTDTGRPYFVMELVQGIPITQYCDDKQLDTQGARLELFVQVCNADPARAPEEGEGDHSPRSQAVECVDRHLRWQAGSQDHRLRRGQGALHQRLTEKTMCSRSSARSLAHWNT